MHHGTPLACSDSVLLGTTGQLLTSCNASTEYLLIVTTTMNASIYDRIAHIHLAGVVEVQVAWVALEGPPGTPALQGEGGGVQDA